MKETQLYVAHFGKVSLRIDLEIIENTFKCGGGKEKYIYYMSKGSKR